MRKGNKPGRDTTKAHFGKPDLPASRGACSRMTHSAPRAQDTTRLGLNPAATRSPGGPWLAPRCPTQSSGSPRVVGRAGPRHESSGTSAPNLLNLVSEGVGLAGPRGGEGAPLPGRVQSVDSNLGAPPGQQLQELGTPRRGRRVAMERAPFWRPRTGERWFNWDPWRAPGLSFSSTPSVPLAGGIVELSVAPSRDSDSFGRQPPLGAGGCRGGSRSHCKL